MISVPHQGFIEVFSAFIAEIWLSDRDYVVRVALKMTESENESITVGGWDQQFELDLTCFRGGKKKKFDWFVHCRVLELRAGHTFRHRKEQLDGFVDASNPSSLPRNQFLSLGPTI